MPPAFTPGAATHTRGSGSKLTGRILLVDDDRIVLESLGALLRADGHEVIAAGSTANALREVERSSIDVMVADVRLPDGDGIELLRTVRDRRPDVPVVVISGYGTIESAVEAMKSGAFDFLSKPFRGEHIQHVVARALEKRARSRVLRSLKRSFDHPCNLQEVIGRTYQMQRVFDLVEAVADSKATVLMHGETGTGKSLVARIIHQLSQRRNRPFVEVSCGVIPETLLASELFGHTKGAFTGAMSDKDGKFRAAEGGTIFLDEVSCASPNLQMKLLRVLHSKQFEPLGSNQTLTADVRVILATNADLRKEVEKGRFREDLYYRIDVVNIGLPPLRERLSDIPPLAEHFLEKYTQNTSKRVRGFSEGVLECMQRYRWPGNVRELENCVERAVVLTRHECIVKEDLPPQVVRAAQSHAPHAASGNDGSTPLKEALGLPERQIILAALNDNEWNRSQTASTLQINRSTLYKKMKRYGIEASLQGSAPHSGS